MFMDEIFIHTFFMTPTPYQNDLTTHTCPHERFFKSTKSEYGLPMASSLNHDEFETKYGCVLSV